MIKRKGTMQSSREKKYEEQLARLAAIVESSDDAIVSKTLNGIITSWNRAAERMFGYKAKEAIGKHITLIIPPELHKEEEIIINKLRKGQKIKHFETTRLRKDGKRIAISLTISPIRNRQGIIIGASKIARNITERKSMEDTLQRQRDQLEIILESISDGITLQAVNGELIYANEAAAKTLGYTSVRQLIKTPVNKILEKFEVMDEFGNPFPLSNLPGRLALQGQNPPPLVLRFRVGKNRKEHWSIVKATPVLDKNKNVLFAINVFHNITERKILERQKDDFIGVASHELKTPITSLKAFAQVLEKTFKQRGDKQTASMLSKMDTQINKLTKLIAQLLDMTRLGEGRLEFQKKRFDFNKLVKEIVEEIQRTTEKHTIIMQLAQTKSVSGDRDRYGQVITNFLTNAIKYSPQATKIIVKTEVKLKTLIFSVTDFGWGIPQNKQAHVFERFFRVKHEDVKTYPGLGLGLYISSEIVKRQGGKIWLQSKEGEGSTFFFSINLT